MEFVIAGKYEYLDLRFLSDYWHIQYGVNHIDTEYTFVKLENTQLNNIPESYEIELFSVSSKEILCVKYSIRTEQG